jgi:hypothetical protein
MLEHIEILLSVWIMSSCVSWDTYSGEARELANLGKLYAFLTGVIISAIISFAFIINFPVINIINNYNNASIFELLAVVYVIGILAAQLFVTPLLGISYLNYDPNSSQRLTSLWDFNIIVGALLGYLICTLPGVFAGDGFTAASLLYDGLALVLTTHTLGNFLILLRSVNDRLSYVL